MNSVVDANDSDFAEVVLQSDIPVVVDFWAQWCGPCLKLTPLLDELAEEYSGRCKIVKVNIDDNMEVASTSGVTSLPTLMYYVNGEVAHTMMAPKNKAAIADVIDSLLSP